MADILVTVPKLGINSFFDEIEDCEDRDLKFNWLLSRKPKHLAVGDYVYFLMDNEIQYRMEVQKLLPNYEFTCETTGKVWGKRFAVQGDAPEPIDVYPKTLKSFMSFRYLESYPDVAEFYDNKKVNA